MDRDTFLETAIRERNVRAIVDMFFESSGALRSGFRTEGMLWDYKAGCPAPGSAKELAWSSVAKHVLAFHNVKGGVLLFGIDDRFQVIRTNTRLDTKQVNDQLRRYLGDQFWVEFHREFIQADQAYIGLLLVPPRGAVMQRFVADAPSNGRGVIDFRIGCSAIRKGDSSIVLSPEDALRHVRALAIPEVGSSFAVDEPFFRILHPEYETFVERPKQCALLDDALRDRRTSVTSLLGIGGMGKTALATWAALRAYDRAQFEFIVSITAKDRELTTSGINALDSSLTTYDSLLDAVLHVLRYTDLGPDAKVVQKEATVRGLLENSNGLLFVDNLETVDDVRIVEFLETLPVGCRALVTSRRTVVRRAVFPIDLESMGDVEATEFMRSLATRSGLAYVKDLTLDDCVAIGVSCGGIALAIKWSLARASSADEALRNARGLTEAGKQGEELLEFCFRRVFERMSPAEQSVLQVLALFQRPLPTECILVGARLPEHSLLDANELLIVDGLVARAFDRDRNDYAFSLPPVVRRFVSQDLNQRPNVEREIRSRLRDWFEASDVASPEERLVVSAFRQGKEGAENALLDLALAAANRGDATAEELFVQALRRNPKSHRVAREFAEYYRHQKVNVGEALRLYEQAAANAPKSGRDRVLIFREWGMLLRDSGDPDATELARQKFEIALRTEPTDVLSIHGLAHMHDRAGHYRKVIELLEPLAATANLRTKTKSLPLLIKAYGRCNELLKEAESREELRRIGGRSEATR